MTSVRHPQLRRLSLESLEHREVPAVLTTSVDDDNYVASNPTDWDGTDNLLSLREAIRMVNQNADTVIDFAGRTVQIGTTVDPTGDLPDITRTATVEGGTLDGNGLPGGLTLSAGGTVRNMTIVRVDGTALTVGGTAALVENNFIGTDANGTTGLGNDLGILINGSNGTYRANVISANTEGGVFIRGNTNTLTANLIGLAPEGTIPLRNGGPGIQVGVQGPGGLLFTSTGNVIGGYFPENRNFISGFTTAGVLVTDGARSTRVLGNYIGLHVEGGAVSGGNDGDGVLVEGFARGTLIGGPGDSQNWIVGTNAGVHIDGANGTRVVGNVIGLQASGSPPAVALRNDVGVLVRGATNTVIGEVQAGDHNPSQGEIQEATGNVIAGSTGPGISVESSRLTRIENNRVGLDIFGRAGTGAPAGTANVGPGIRVLDSFRTDIGGPTEPSGNWIAGNEGAGVLIEGASSVGNRLSSNRIGIVNEFIVNVRGGGRGNRGGGVVLAGGAHDNWVGVPGSAPNLISGNSLAGVRVTGAGTTDNRVLNNQIGGNPNTSEPALGNDVGVVIEAGANRTRVGDGTEAGRNRIAGSLGDAIRINGADRAQVRGNWIGTDPAGTGAQGNAGDGVHIVSGSLATVARNTIAFNTGFGIRVDAGTGNTFDANAIYNNTAGGISLAPGANAGIGRPVITTATQIGPVVRVEGVAAARPNSVLRVQVFASPAARADGRGEGRQFLGTATVFTNAAGAFVALFVGTVPTGQVLTLTVTDLAGNTSEFSDPVSV